MPETHAAELQSEIKEIAVIAPDPTLFSLVEKIRQAAQMDFSIHEGLCDEAVVIAQALVEKGTKILVSRGESSTLIRNSGLKVPVLDIPITEVDIASLLMQARRISTRIAVIGFGPTLRAAEAMAPMLDAEVKRFRLQTVKDIPAAVEQTERERFTVAIGSPQAMELLRQKGITGFPLTSREDQVLTTLEEAMKLIKLSQSGAEWRIRQQAVLDSMREHVFLLDSEGRMLNSNLPEGESLLDHPELLEAVLENKFWSGTISNDGQVYLCKSQPVDAVKNLGALVFLEKSSPLNLDSQRESMRKGFVPRVTFDDMLHKTESMRLFIKKAKQYSRSNAPVLLLGESGTGKEYLAQSIHGHSRRQSGPFVSVSCAAIPEQLLESELFGYQSGAFTGASRSGKRGLFELADTGTIFLDEVGELPLLVQAKILRVLEEGSFLRIGGDRLTHVDVRVIAATNRNLVAMVKEKTFRDDLFFRLAVLRLEVPPLRERREDIPVLLEHFIEQACKQNSVPSPLLPPQTTALLASYPFPGNVRELRSLAERLAVTSLGGPVSPELLSDFLDFPELLGAAPEQNGRLSAGETALIRSTLAECGYNRSQAARMLGIAPSTLWRKCKQFGLNEEAPKKAAANASLSV